MRTPERKVNCPSCGKIVTWNHANQYRPFCCERCKLIDLGAWAAEKHAIPGEPLPPGNDEDNHGDEY
ncbi:MAG: DNA gyrase inhibitor YacG [Pseudohongiellaceae bacterium]